MDFRKGRWIYRAWDIVGVVALMTVLQIPSLISWQYVVAVFGIVVINLVGWFEGRVDLQQSSQNSLSKEKK